MNQLALRSSDPLSRGGGPLLLIQAVLFLDCQINSSTISSRLLTWPPSVTRDVEAVLDDGTFGISWELVQKHDSREPTVQTPT